MPIKPFLEAGQITGTHGVRGEVRVMPWCDSPEVYARLHTLYWDEHGEQPVRVHSRAHKSMALTVLEGVDTVEKAAALMDKYGYKGYYFLYCILMDFKESFKRVNYWRQKDRFVPFAQPYRDWGKSNQIIPQWQKDLARWSNRRWVYRACEFSDFEPRKNFYCKQYFD